MIEALIFDLDGVLADTIEYQYRAWKHLADLYDIPFDRAAMNRLRGRQRRDCLLDLLGDRPVGEAEIQRLMTLKEAFYLQDIGTMQPENLLPGVLPLVQAAHAQGLKLGVASASMTAKIVLQQTSLISYMDVVADGHTVCRSKPAPDIFVWVAGALGIRPPQALVFEDSHAGVTAARTAGMYVVGVGDGSLTQQAHITVQSLADISLPALLQQASY